MKTQLIKTQDKFILVSDEEIKDGFCYNPITGEIINLSIKGAMSFDEIVNKCKKIIAGIPELPSIDFSLLSEEDCKRIGWVDVEKLAQNMLELNFILGFKTAQSLNDKVFSLEDMKKYHNIMCLYGNVKAEEFIQSLQQTVWNVKVDMDCVYQGKCVKIHTCDEKQPKITEGSIKIIKIL